MRLIGDGVDDARTGCGGTRKHSATIQFCHDISPSVKTRLAGLLYGIAGMLAPNACPRQSRQTVMLSREHRCALVIPHYKKTNRDEGERIFANSVLLERLNRSRQRG